MEIRTLPKARKREPHKSGYSMSIYYTSQGNTVAQSFLPFVCFHCPVHGGCVRNKNSSICSSCSSAEAALVSLFCRAKANLVPVVLASGFVSCLLFVWLLCHQAWSFEVGTNLLVPGSMHLVSEKLFTHFQLLQLSGETGAPCLQRGNGCCRVVLVCFSGSDSNPQPTECQLQSSETSEALLRRNISASALLASMLAQTSQPSGGGCSTFPLLGTHL